MELLLELFQALVDPFRLFGDEMGDRIRIRVFGDIADLVSRETREHIVVVSGFADHFRIEYFDREHVAASADQVHARRR